MFDLSIGIMAYNEEAGIGRLLEALRKQELGHAVIKEIIVVASGCTDRTEAIVQDFAKQYPRVRLLTQTRRKGKASAVNLFLAQACGDICILESADTFPEAGAIESLVKPFVLPAVGMTGARPIPVNSSDTFMGYAVNLMWSLHHAIALVSPKLGELIAFRNFIRQIPENTAVDEASIEAIVRDAGYELRYEPKAVVKNKGPENMRDFLRQRRRIAAGHKHLQLTTGYRVSTVSLINVTKALLNRQTWNIRDFIWTVGTILLETAARGLGNFDVRIRRQTHVVWSIATSTKAFK